MTWTAVIEERVSKLAIQCQAARHQIDHGDLNQDFVGFWLAFVVFGVSAVTSETSKGAFDDPALGQPTSIALEPATAPPAYHPLRSGRECAPAGRRRERAVDDLPNVAFRGRSHL
jgi:hypothetical protein